MPPKAVIFDFGGVIVSSPFEAFSRYERANALPDSFLRHLNATDPDTNAWARLERNELDAAGFAAQFQAGGEGAGGGAPPPGPADQGQRLPGGGGGPKNGRPRKPLPPHQGARARGAGG